MTCLGGYKVEDNGACILDEYSRCFFNATVLTPRDL